MKRLSALLAMVLLITSVWGVYHKVGEITDPPGEGISLSGDCLYMSTIAVFDTLYCVDVSDPSAPQVVGGVSTPGRCKFMVDGQLGYSLQLSEWGDIELVAVYDLSFPFAPVLLCEYELPYLSDFFSPEGEVVIIGHGSFVEGEPSILGVVDVSQPEAPSYVGEAQMEDSISSFIRHGDYLYVRSYESLTNTYHLHVYDFSDPSSLEEINQVDVIPGCMAIHGDVLYSSWNRYDIADPTTPVYMDTVFEDDRLSLLQVFGDDLIVGEWIHISAVGACRNARGPYPPGFRIYHIDENGDPILVGVCSQAGYPVVSDDCETVYSFAGGCISITDISDPTPPEHYLGGCIPQRETRKVEVQGDTACLAIYAINYTGADIMGGLGIVDVTNPADPQIVTVFEEMECGIDLHAEGDVTFLASHNELYAVDVSDPYEAEVIDSVDLEDDVWAICFYDGYAYGNSFDYGGGLPESCLWVIDCTDPSSLDAIGSLTPGAGQVDACVLVDEVLYLNGAGIELFDVSDPANITEYPSFATDINIRYFEVHGDFVYCFGDFDITNEETGLLTLDISDPTQPVEINAIPFPEGHSAACCYVWQSYLLIADNAWNQILIYDITEPTQPELVETFSWNLATYDMWVEDGLLYTANGRYGMHILDLTSLGVDEPAAPEVPATMTLSNHPNPFNPSTTIAFELPEASSVKLEVFNVRGQRVATLADGLRQAGSHEAVWEAQGVASGVYFARLSSNGQEVTTKLLLLK